MNEKKDVGLLTWHYFDNVGSNLQAYAMYHIVTSMGYSAEFINYRGREKKNIIKDILKRICSAIDLVMPNILPQKIRAQAFRFQMQYLPQSKREDTAEHLLKYADNYKMFLCGSDQIWAPNLLEEVYLFSFLPEKSKRFAYAASIGLDKIPDDKKKIYKKYLSKFAGIAVRERQGADLVSELLNKNIEWVLDPTFLLDSEHWLSLARYPQRQDYIFCYFLGMSEVHRKWVDEIAKRKNRKVVCLTSAKEKKREGWEYIPCMGPREFLGYIYKSSFVITDSFHGMALSINLKKDFYVLERFNSEDIICQNSRVYNILQAFELENRMIKSGIVDLAPIVYSEIEGKYQYYKNKSMDILKGMLRDGCMK